MHHFIMSSRAYMGCSRIKKIESPPLHKSCHDWTTTKKEKMPLKFEIEYLQTQELIPEQLKTVKENAC